jgi:hypothetical protein
MYRAMEEQGQILELAGVATSTILNVEDMDVIEVSRRASKRKAKFRLKR